MSKSDMPMPDSEIISPFPRIYPTQWYSTPALALETPALRVITVPTMGAKIVSIFDRIVGHEWLLPPKNGYFQPVDYGAAFVEQDMSGWDEMFPTIDRCMYPARGAYFGTELPDHGEVWSLAWTYDESITDAIRLSVLGRALPYMLSRTIRITDERTLLLSYEVINTGTEPFSALWVAHPQLAVDKATQIVLPSSVMQVINVLPSQELPVIGQLCNWAVTTTPTGEQLQLDRVRSASEHKHRKVYLPPDHPVQWAGLQQHERRGWLRFLWNTAEVRYLGIWVDEGSFNSVMAVALEPSTGFYDSLARAWKNNRAMYLLPNIPCRWSLALELGAGSIPGNFF
jgi:galactose mutarotase-like enzyme